MKFHDSFLDEIRAHLPVSQVVSRRVPLKRRGREFVGLSPFNQEKTPSFTVNDQKGFYHCFSSGKHGDIFGFVMDTEGLSFPEAVERLAGEAGLPMPKPDPQFERVAKERLGLIDALEAATVFFEEQLTTREGREALLYAERRGLSPATLKEFRIGFAPNAKETLKATLIKRGFSESQLLDAGLLIKPDDGRAPYDRFRNRLIIPILDAKSRVIAFGARALDPATEPKYLNSPETKLFDKGSTVFNFARARTPAFDKGELIVVEGYMDVIALHQAGFANVVATLGTAFTERQMDQLWLLAPEPVICFDGDRAGEAAAARAIDRMLPILREGHSFRFAFLPRDKDPDDLLRSEGPAAFVDVMKAAMTLADAFWQRGTRNTPINTPEQKAALETRLEAEVATIRNALVRKHYWFTVRIRLSRLFWDHDRAAWQRARPRSLPSLDGNALECLVLGMLVEFPELFAQRLERVKALQMSGRFAAFKDKLEEIIQLPMEVKISTFYKTLKPTEFFPLLDEVHGDENPDRGLRRGHRLRARFPILKKHPPHEFVDRCLDLFLDKLEHRHCRADVDEADHDFLKRPDQAHENRLLLLVEAEELQRRRMEVEEVELDEWAATIRSAFDEDGSPAPTYRRGNRFEETIARLKGENIGGQRGRRPDRRPDQR
jgi:DNA primase